MNAELRSSHLILLTCNAATYNNRKMTTKKDLAHLQSVFSSSILTISNGSLALQMEPCGRSFHCATGREKGSGGEAAYIYLLFEITSGCDHLSKGIKQQGADSCPPRSESAAAVNLQGDRFSVKSSKMTATI